MEKEFGALSGSREPDPSCTGSGPSGFDPARVLFLDIDGVLLPGCDLWVHGNRYLCPHRLAMIRDVCVRTDAKIVVSSTWRYSDDTRSTLLAHGLPVHADWRTPMAATAGAILIAQTRGWEIHRWLSRHPEVTTFAIVDDDSDMLPEQRDRFVQTPFETGLAGDHAERLVAILCDSDGSGEADETGTGSAVGDSAGRNGIAKVQP